MRILVAVLLWAALFVPAQAVPSCGTPEKIAALLLKQFGEYLQHIGTDQKGARIEVYVSKKRTWTIVEVGPLGIVACLKLVGTDWREHEATHER